DQHRRRLAQLAAVAQPSGAAPTARRAALAAWRATRARAAIVPPELILPDRALAALACSAAESEAEVVEVAGPLAGQRAARWAAEVAAVLRAAAARAA